MTDDFPADRRVLSALAQLRSLYEDADDVDAFHDALARGDIAGASDHHPLTAEELHERVDRMMENGAQLIEDYDEVLDQGYDQERVNDDG
jgi:hypothetical protein